MSESVMTTIPETYRLSTSATDNGWPANKLNLVDPNEIPRFGMKSEFHRRSSRFRTKFCIRAQLD